MARFRLIQTEGNHSVEIAEGESLSELIETAAEMEGMA